MKTNLLLILLLCFFFVSCNEDDELNPSEAVLGTYQEVQDEIIEEHDVVQTIKLESGNSFIHEWTVREKGASEDLGYQFYGEGTFTMSDGVIELNYDEKYSLVDPDITFVPKEELDLMETDNAAAFRLKVAEDFSSLSYICPPNAFCVEVSVYDRIN